MAKYLFFTLITLLVLVRSYAQACENGTEYTCQNGQCIDSGLLCDGIWDCSHGEDETDPIACPCDGFLCESGECIDGDWVCDGENDCGLGEDEPPSCPPCFTCINDNSTCLPNYWVCDGYDDCEAGEDEDGCPSTTRGPCDGFECANGDCLPPDWQCDGVQDCENFEDEAGCPCPPDQINCGKCVPEAWWCDTVTDCPDGSDEMNCESSTAVNSYRHHRLVKEHYGILLRRQNQKLATMSLTVEQKAYKRQIQKNEWKAARLMRS